MTRNWETLPRYEQFKDIEAYIRAYRRWDLEQEQKPGAVPQRPRRRRLPYWVGLLMILASFAVMLSPELGAVAAVAAYLGLLVGTDRVMGPQPT